jgi:hypothetical protein
MPRTHLFTVTLLLTASLQAQTLWIDTQPKGGTEWKARETRTVASFNIQPLPEGSTTRYGGLAADKQKATGFFRVQKIGDRWWMIDPDGGRFLFCGVNTVKPQTQFAAKEPFDRLYGSTAAWADKTLDSFRALGFNGCGGFSDHEALRTASRPMPYTVTLNLMSSFGKSLKLTHQQSGHTGYEQDCLPVFHPDFEAHCLKLCTERLGTMKDDPSLVGVFSDNEMPIAKDMLDRMLKLDEKKVPFTSMKAAAAAFMAGKGEITDDLRRQFVEHVYDIYFRLTTQAIRAALPHHLCLGSRFHGPAVNSASVWRAAGRWCDAISINYYNVWTPQPQHLQQWHEWSGKPCLITEFYAKGADSGMANTTGAGWLVKTQADRGAFYQNFTLALLESKTCIGWHWFKYMDNDPADPKTDPSNKDSNKGMFNTRYEPYQPLLDAMKALNTRACPLIQHFDSSKH